MTIIVGILTESYELFLRMAPFLLFGFFFVGVLHIFIKTETIARHLGKGNFSSVLKASLFGIPLPLCSCGVIPSAHALRKEGASRGAVLSFLISTPTTGIDSILATFALLGGVFAAYRVFSTFVAALCVGVLANLFLKEENTDIQRQPATCSICNENHSATKHTLREQLQSAVHYGFLGKIFRESISWMAIGILIGGTISYFMPPEFIENYLGSGLTAIIVMFFIGTPMYICSSGSIPIAASLMLKGLNPGAAFAFLLAGPATNTVTIAMVGRSLGKKALVIYLLSIFISSVFLGVLFDSLWYGLGGVSPEEIMNHTVSIPLWLETGSAIILGMLVLVNVIRNNKE